MAERSKFQFRMRDLLSAVGLIALAGGFLNLWLRPLPDLPWLSYPWINGEYLLAAGAFAGAGAGCLFHRWGRDALAGFFAAVCYFFFRIFMSQ